MNEKLLLKVTLIWPAGELVTIRVSFGKRNNSEIVSDSGNENVVFVSEKLQLYPFNRPIYKDNYVEIKQSIFFWKYF